MRLLVATLLSSTTLAILNASQNDSSLTISNDRLSASVSKSRGYINALTLDGQNLLVCKMVSYMTAPTDMC